MSHNEFFNFFNVLENIFINNFLTIATEYGVGAKI